MVGLAARAGLRYYAGMPQRTPLRNLWLLYLVCDVAAIVAAYVATLYLRFYSQWGSEWYGIIMSLLSIHEAVNLGPALPLFYLESAFRIIIVLSLSICFLYGFQNLYAGRRFLFRRPASLSIIIANVVALGLYYCYFYARMNVFHPRTVFVTIAVFNVAFCILFRAGLDHLLQFVRDRFHFDECRAILIGSDGTALQLEELVSATGPSGVRVVERIELGAGESVEVRMERIRQRVLSCGAHMIVCADKSLSISGIMRILQLAEELRLEVKVHSIEMNMLLTRAKQAADVFKDAPLVHFAVPSGSETGLWLRGVVTRILASCLFILSLPVLFVIALFVKATSSGPVLFVQERIGINRIPFRMYKFRTMHHLADDAQSEVEKFNESGAGLFKIRKDPRVTFVGRFLRRFSLDELPQLVNVIRGEMALVGPRPLPRRDFENYYEDWHYIRHGGLPGLTCLWQVSGRSDLDFHSMCLLDVYYLRNRSLMLDLRILLKTAVVVLFAKGAY